MAKSENLATLTDLTNPFFAEALPEYTRYKQDRDAVGFDDKMLAGDGMFRCFRNSSFADTEKKAATGVDPDDEPTNADTASIRMFRLVNQHAGLLSAVVNSTDQPISYSPIANPEVFHSAQEGADQAAIHNVLAKYTWKNDGGAEKIYDYAVQLYKYSNVPIQVYWHKEVRHIKVRNPETKKTQWKDVEVSVYPTWKPLSWSMVYADLYAGPIAKQRCVIVLSIVPWSEIQSGEKAGWYDADQVDEIRQNRAKYTWDGNEGADIRKEMSDNEGLDGYDPGDSELFLQWDVYMQAPIEKKEWTRENDYTLWWGTAIGNSLQGQLGEESGSASFVPIRLQTEFDPDGEIPLFMSNALPDDMDMLYHMSWAEAVRPQYAMECSLWNLAFDNNRGLNNLPLAIDMLKFNTEPGDLRNKQGAVWDIQDPNQSIREFNQTSTLGDTATLIGMVQAEQQTAANINENMMGNAFGGRTSATEDISINRFSQQPNIAEIRYVVGNLFKFLGRKYKSYWQGFAPDELIKSIADEGLSVPIYIEEQHQNGEKMPSGMQLYGDFDVELNVIDEFVEDFVQAQQELQLLQIVAGNPALSQSDSHKVDVGFWLRDIMARMKIKKSDRIIVPGSGSDGHLRQRDELRIMAATGEYIDPKPEEDHAAHISECDTELLRYSAILDEDLSELGQEAIDTQSSASVYIKQLVKPHREAHKQMQAQGESALQGTPPVATEPQTPGNLAGQVPQAALGQAAGQGPV